jgi:hypothetical protein
MTESERTAGLFVFLLLVAIVWFAWYASGLGILVGEHAPDSLEALKALPPSLVGTPRSKTCQYLHASGLYDAHVWSDDPEHRYWHPCHRTIRF